MKIDNEIYRDANSCDLGARIFNSRYTEEVEKKSNWIGGDTKTNPGIRLYRSKEEIKSENPNDSKQLK